MSVGNVHSAATTSTPASEASRSAFIRRNLRSAKPASTRRYCGSPPKWRRIGPSDRSCLSPDSSAGPRRLGAKPQTAADLGYHAGLLSLAAMKGASEDELIAHCRAVAEVIPLVGFYLQTAVGGIPLSANFWRRFAEIEQVVAIKIAPFDRYRTLDVDPRRRRGSRRGSHRPLYRQRRQHRARSVTPYRVRRDGDRGRECGSRAACSATGASGPRAPSSCSPASNALSRQAPIDNDLLALAAKVTDCNAAFFDVANNFRGCIAGCHEVLAAARFVRRHLVPRSRPKS